MNTTTTRPTATTGTTSREQRDLLDTLHTHRDLLKGTTNGMTNEQANSRSTISALTLGGIIKHVTEVEAHWVRFIVEGADAFAGEAWVGADWETLAAGNASQAADDAAAEWESGFSMLPDETLAGLLAEYDIVAARTDELVATLPDLDLAHPLPAAPWFEPGADWSARRVITHIVAETAQHAGHADIIRESIDGAKSMG